MTDNTFTSPEAEPRKLTGGFHVSQEPVSGEGSEGDAHKYDIGEEPAPPAPSAERPEYEDLGDLPASYPEDRLFLAARDPRWLFSYWDFDWSRYSGDAMLGGALQFFLRTRTAEGEDEAVFEIQPAARNWYVPVVKSGTTYFADIGFFERDGAWHSIVRSGPATTPPENLAGDERADFATIPARLTYEQMLEMLRGKMEEGESLVSALARIAGEGRVEFQAGRPPTWTEEQKCLLAALLGEELTERVSLGSAEIDQLLRKTLAEKLHGDIAGGFPARIAGLLAPGPHSLFSGFGASWSAQPFSAKRGREFFLHVNTEIIFYGGTDPDATVWIDGQEIRLSPDGTFRYHFTLADGDFAIPIIARSPDGVEERSATLTFTRGTRRTGEVGATAQPAELSPLIGKQ
ncbi:MAG: DUF4912 domain-containing protein [Chthoniobacter sp.]|nr:DUF4912 domain-containing protein [Chthoniobacter sp.]